MIESFIFYMFSFFIITGSMCVVISRNPVYSVLFLIFTFFNAAGIFVLLRAEFLAMALVIVYVGAVIILFLFVVMLINIRNIKKSRFNKYSLISIFLILILMFELIYFIKVGINNLPEVSLRNRDFQQEKNFTFMLGLELFNKNYYILIIASLILTVSMIASVVIATSEDEKKSVSRIQDVYKQNTRNKDKAIYKVSMKPEEGMKIDKRIK